ncbi:cobalamin-binding protein [Chungangia koreensis]|uniref:Cobalamin-binding protein n=1 Tax=Chungangia koreensis TaxID=752657 RepID=A0ABV8X2V6_9LACT
MRIISLCPSNTELLTYLGLIDHLVGVDDFSDWPQQINHLPRLGPDLSIKMDLVEKLKPDLVLASLSVPGMEKNVIELEKREIPHIILNPQSLHDIADDLITVGKICGIEAQAKLRAAEYLAFIHVMKKRTSQADTRPSLYWEWWPKPVFTPGVVNWLTEVSQIAGGRNIFDDVELASVQTDWDDVLQRKPDYILLAWVGVRPDKVKPELVLKRPGWTELNSVKNGRLHMMEEELYCRPSPRLLEGALKLGKLIHPELYNDLELPAWRILK